MAKRNVAAVHALLNAASGSLVLELERPLEANDAAAADDTNGGDDARWRLRSDERSLAGGNAGYSNRLNLVDM